MVWLIWLLRITLRDLVHGWVRDHWRMAAAVGWLIRCSRLQLGICFSFAVDDIENPKACEGQNSDAANDAAGYGASV